MIASNNYINIQGWMVTELGLKGNELLVFAVIYGFSQDGVSKYSGGLRYLAEWTNSTKQGILKNLKSLEEKGLICKKEYEKNRVKYCEYYSTKFNGGIQQSLTGGIQQSLPNNIYIDKLNNNNKKEKINQKSNQVVDKELLSFGELSMVKLTQQEFDKIKKNKPDLYEKAIDRLDTWLATTTKKIKKGSHYAYFKNNSWVWEDLTPKIESGVLVERGKFFIDDSINEYKEVLSEMREKDIDACWEWIMKNKEGQVVSKQWVIDRLNQFKWGKNEWTT